MSPTKTPPVRLASDWGREQNQAFAQSRPDNWIVSESRRDGKTLAMMIACAHATTKKFGKDRKGNPRVRLTCGKTWTEQQPKLLGKMQVPVADAKLALRLLVEGMSIRATERTTGIAGNTLCKLLVFFGDACRRFLDQRMRGLTLSHLQFDEQRTYVAKKQARLTLTERAERHDIGDVFFCGPASTRKPN